MKNTSALTLVAKVCLAGTVLLTTLHLQAQAVAPLENASVDDIVESLGGNPNGGLPFKAYRRTAAPDAATHACPEVMQAPTTTHSGLEHKNLTVVYAAEGSPSLNLAINFMSNSDAIQRSSYAVLNNLAQALQGSSMLGVRVAIAGHTDAQGNSQSNLVLSCARAIAVRNVLIQKGVAADRLGAYGFGAHRPLTPGSAASPLNRRVEIRRAN